MFDTIEDRQEQEDLAGMAQTWSAFDVENTKMLAILGHGSRAYYVNHSNWLHPFARL
jgi:hypothetical protein